MTEETKQTEENKEEVKPTLFQVLVDAIGRVANDQKLTVDSVIGQLELVKRHVIDNVLANANEQAAEQSADADTQEPEVVTPEVV
jgi:hypothetical protein